MIRLFLMWAVLTGVLFGFYYFVDRVQKKETAKWVNRLIWCGVLPAIGIAGAIFFERSV